MSRNSEEIFQITYCLYRSKEPDREILFHERLLLLVTVMMVMLYIVFYNYNDNGIYLKVTNKIVTQTKGCAASECNDIRQAGSVTALSKCGLRKGDLLFVLDHHLLVSRFLLKS